MHACTQFSHNNNNAFLISGDDMVTTECAAYDDRYHWLLYTPSSLACEMHCLLAAHPQLFMNQ